MSANLTYGPFLPEVHLEAVVRATSLAFGGDAPGVRGWLENAGHEHVRVLRDELGEAAASLLALPMGQHFGGRSVPMEGVAGVAVAPESRGRGLALTLMREQVREAAERGVPLSCLYASTQALYRQVGYEQAGLLFRTNIPLRTIGVRDRTLPVRELGDADDGQIRACYTEFARRFNGTLERGAYAWGRVRQMREETYKGFGVFSRERPGALEGYFFMSQRRKPETGRHDVALSDLAFTTAAAGRRLLGLLADLATVGDDAVVYGAPLHPVCTLMPQQYHTSKFVDAWMVRINLVKEAIEARGYAESLQLELGLEIVDDVVRQNAGEWRMRVREGRASLERGRAACSLRCDARALAAIYTGFYSAGQAATLGLVRGDPPALSAADALFSGQTPWMTDRF